MNFILRRLVWFRYDQLNGKVVYQATLRFPPDGIVIEARRDIESRGLVKRVDRPHDYDPSFMTAFALDTDTAAQPLDLLTVDPPSVEDQVRNFKSLRYFSNSFRAWCAYGLSTSGLAADGKTWISVLPDEQRKGAPPFKVQPKVPHSATAITVQP